MKRVLGILYDVSNSMKNSFNITQNINSTEIKSNYLMHLMNKLTKDKDIYIFTLLFGGQWKSPIIDFISYIEKMNKYISNLNLPKENQKEEFISLMKRIYPDIENKLNEEINLTDLNMAFIIGLIKENKLLKENINPNSIKIIISFLSIVNKIISFIDSLISKKNNMKNEEYSLKRFLKYYIQELFTIIYEQMRNDNTYKIIQSIELQPILVKTDELIEKYIPILSPDENKNFIYYLKDKIYGERELAEVTEKAFNIFTINKNNFHQQILIIVTDGLSNDLDKVYNIIEQMKSNSVYVLVCYISNFYSNHMLYNDIRQIQINQERGKILFQLSSEIFFKDPFFKCFLQNGWIIKSNKCRLFIGVNNEKSMNEFIDLLNSLLTFEENTFNDIIRELGKMTLSSFIYSYNMNMFQSKKQIFGTCWANACAACIYFARKRIVGREDIPFEIIRNHLLVNYSLDNIDGNCVDRVLRKVVNKYGLKVKELFSENEARKVLKKGIPCVASFSLSGNQWANFKQFFNYNRTGYLNSEIINQTNNQTGIRGGHAVVLIDANDNGLTFLNSWGMGFGDNGKFRIVNEDVLTDADDKTKIRYFEIYFTKNELSHIEKYAYKKYVEDVYKSLYYLMCSEDTINKLNEKEIKCEKCPNKSKACLYRGNIIRVICPKCHQDYKPKKKEMIDYLNFKIINNGNYDNSTYNQNILYNAFKEMNAYRINEIKTKEDIFDLECTAFNNSVNCIIMLSDNRLCACSSDHSIKIFDIHTGKDFNLRVDKPQAHSEEIRCIEEIQRNILASGGKNDIKIWEITDDQLILNKEINNAHRNYINKIIKLENGEFATCSDDGLIKFWSSHYNEKESKNAHHGFKINNIYYFKDVQNNDRKTLVSISNETKHVTFWKISNDINKFSEFNNIKIIESFRRNKLINHNMNLVQIENLLLLGEENQISLFQILKNKNRIKLYEYKNDDLGNILALNTINNHGNLLLLAGSDNGFIFIYEICGDGNEVSLNNINIIRHNKKALKGKTQYAISCLTTYSHYIIASSIDNLIKMYTFYFEYIHLN